MPGVPAPSPGVLVGAPTDMLRVYCSADSSRRKTLELIIPSILAGEQWDGEETGSEKATHLSLKENVVQI